ncbi:transcriptional regulator [halophilic archaeon]|nr:transcriptional regulator [halophilic archaeon]
MRSLQHTQLLAAGVFVAATFTLTVQLINPSPVMVTVGENGTDVAELGNYFRYRDVVVVAFAASLLGASSTYLLTNEQSGYKSDPASKKSSLTADQNDDLAPTDELLEARRQEWEEIAEQLTNNEQVIYETLLDADGVLPQNEIVDRTDISKATVSRVLDSLETKNLVERKRRGMGNVVLLL